VCCHLIAGGGPVRAATVGWDAALNQAFAKGGAPALAGLVVGPEGAISAGARGVRRLGGSAAGAMSRPEPVDVFMCEPRAGRLWFATVLAAPERGLGFITLSNDGAAGQGACTTLIQRLAEVSAAA
jgi:hypothetical protein